MAQIRIRTKIVFVIIVFCLLNNFLLAQVETISADHPVYYFLKKMYVSGVLPEYDDIVLPLSKNQVIKYLKVINENKSTLSSQEKLYLERLDKYFNFSESNIETISLLDSKDNLVTEFFWDKRKELYYYKDSSMTFYISPDISFQFISTTDKTLNGKNALFTDIGGKFTGSYNNWFAFHLQGSNGFISGDRNAARLIKKVEQSLTFNETGLNFVDGTRGYVRFEKDIASLQLGRERILWGTGYNSKLIIDKTPPIFDFVRADFKYKSFTYNYLHGWLTQPMFRVNIDSLRGDARFTSSKYIAISRIGISPANNFNFGITQIVIYANRAFELAYLNPFLFYESAQRSLNDTDNSLLGLDFRYRPVNGLEINATLLLDDLNYDSFLKGKWNTSENRIAAQLGFYLSSPVFFPNTTFKFEFLKLRPYMFSHVGLGESLTYTNNSYMLGSDIQPNSGRISFELNHKLSSVLDFILNYNYSIHGNNEYDENNNIIHNYGGNVFYPVTIGDDGYAKFLAGIREFSHQFNFSLMYEPVLNTSVSATLQYNYESKEKAKKRWMNIWVNWYLFPF